MCQNLVCLNTQRIHQVPVVKDICVLIGKRYVSEIGLPKYTKHIPSICG